MREEGIRAHAVTLCGYCNSASPLLRVKKMYSHNYCLVRQVRQTGSASRFMIMSCQQTGRIMRHNNVLCDVPRETRAGPERGLVLNEPGNVKPL